MGIITCLSHLERTSSLHVKLLASSMLAANYNHVIPINIVITQMFFNVLGIKLTDTTFMTVVFLPVIKIIIYKSAKMQQIND